MILFTVIIQGSGLIEQPGFMAEGKEGSRGYHRGYWMFYKWHLLLAAPFPAWPPPAPPTNIREWVSVIPPFAGRERIRYFWQTDPMMFTFLTLHFRCEQNIPWVASVRPSLCQCFFMLSSPSAKRMKGRTLRIKPLCYQLANTDTGWVPIGHTHCKWNVIAKHRGWIS